MDSMISELRIWPVWKELKHFAVSVACEDHSSSARADEFCRGLTRTLSRNCKVVTESWLFNQLRVPELRAIAAAEAALAHLIIISVHRSEAVPEELKDWLNLRLGMRNKRGIVLLALFDPVYRGFSGPMEGYLQEVAKRGGMEFQVASEDACDWR